MLGNAQDQKRSIAILHIHQYLNIAHGGEGGNAFDADYSNGFSNFGPISYLSHLFMHRIVHILQDRYGTLSLKNMVYHLLNIWHVIYQ